VLLLLKSPVEPCCSREGWGPRIDEESGELFEEFDPEIGMEKLDL
jgi:hypothetical protein